MKTMRFIKIAVPVLVLAIVALVFSGTVLADSQNSNKTSDANAPIPQTVRDVVNSKLVIPLREKHYGKDGLKKGMMSRCPSGIHSAFTSETADKGYFYGEVNKWSGCESHQLCKYRATETTVEVANPDGTYGPASTFIAKSEVKDYYPEEIEEEDMPAPAKASDL